MRRSIAIVLAWTLSAVSGSASALHVHAYTDHDHREHHHGPAAHAHHAIGTHHDSDATMRLEGCDPGRHRVGCVFVCGAAPQSPSIDTAAVSPAIRCGDSSSGPGAQVTDVRVHGPPPAPHVSPRAPPVLSA